MYKQFNSDMTLSYEATNLLQRPLGISTEEISISLRSERTFPRTLNDHPLALSDVPIVAGKDIESSRGDFDPSPEVFKFILATHMTPITISRESYENGLNYLQDRLGLIADSNPAFSNERGKGGILDMNIHGKPLSVLHIALSDTRAGVLQELSDDSVKKAAKLFEANINDTLEIWADAFPGQTNEFDFSWLVAEQRRFIGYIIRNGPSTPEQVSTAFNDEISRERFLGLWKDLYEKRAIYEKDVNVFEVIPYYRHAQP